MTDLTFSNDFGQFRGKFVNFFGKLQIMGRHRGINVDLIQDGATFFNKSHFFGMEEVFFPKKPVFYIFWNGGSIFFENKLAF